QGSGPSAILAYEIASSATTTWSDAADGRLVGANDDFFIMQRYATRDNGAAQIVIERHDVSGKTKTLAEFSDDARAGQTRVVGDRVVFVNADGKIVVVPLNGDGRFNFEPF